MWANAYLEQARSDWDTRKLIAENACAACHELHYLQMTAEKLGKAVLLRSGTTNLDSVNRTHKAFVRFLRVAAKNPGLRQALQFNIRQLHAYVKEILPVADQIERLAPTLARDGPNAEYPWETPSGEVKVPASYAFPVEKDLRGPHGRKLLKLIDFVLDKFEALF
ncbi:MAG: hypothetical protein E3J21_01340 [Anaerolineales bacterium]|nr:MAG: hypothetical protein E3J21_01340 [Anaerolineales bacterium]